MVYFSFKSESVGYPVAATIRKNLEICHSPTYKKEKLKKLK